MGSPAALKAGRPLAGPYSAVLWSLVGDLDFYTSAMNLPRSTLAAGPCWLCRCTKYGANSWKNFKLTAPWILTIWSPQGWRGWAERPQTELFRLPWFSACNIAPDWLHVKYLGNDLVVYGSLLYLLAFAMLPNSPADNMSTIWQDIQAVYREYDIPCRFFYLNTVRMFLKGNNTVKLRGKGAQTRYLYRPMLILWSKYMNNGIQIHKKIKLALKLNCIAEDLLVEYKGYIALPEEPARKFKEAISGYLLLLDEIQQHFDDDDPSDHPALFRLTEKCHFIQHVSLLTQTISPRMLWAFCGEDQQRHVQKLAEASMKRLGPSRASVKIASRYRLAMHLLFQSHRE